MCKSCKSCKSCTLIHFVRFDTFRAVCASKRARRFAMMTTRSRRGTKCLRSRPSSGRRGRLLHGLFDPLHVDLPCAGAGLLEDLKHHGPSIICHLGGAPFNQTAVKFTAAPPIMSWYHFTARLNFSSTFVELLWRRAVADKFLSPEMIFTRARETSIVLHFVAARAASASKISRALNQQTQCFHLLLLAVMCMPAPSQRTADALEPSY